MMWYGGDGWDWGGLIVNVLAMVVLWGAVIIAIGLAIHFSQRGPRRSVGPEGHRFHPGRGRVAARGVRREMDNDGFYRRVMWLCELR